MPDEEFETTEFKERLEEATERALEVSGQRSRWVTYLSFTTALIAVLAAIAALESGTFSNDALMEKNAAVLAQAKASDLWAYYQAKGVKAAIYTAYGSTDKAQQETAEQQEISRRRTAVSVARWNITIARLRSCSVSIACGVRLGGRRRVSSVNQVGLAYFVDGFLLLF